MSIINLQANESILYTSNSGEVVGIKSNSNDKLILTNKRIVYVHTNFVGYVKDTCDYYLNQIKIVNNKPKIYFGETSILSDELSIEFYNGTVTFKLSLIDVRKWHNKINHILVGEEITSRKSIMEKNMKQFGSQGKILGTIGAVKDALGIVSGPQAPVSVSVTTKCIGCMAPLSGKTGDTITCKYCDTTQTL